MNAPRHGEAEDLDEDAEGVGPHREVQQPLSGRPRDRQRPHDPGDLGEFPDVRGDPEDHPRDQAEAAADAGQGEQRGDHRRHAGDVH
jgi:hypothetical protein